MGRRSAIMWSARSNRPRGMPRRSQLPPRSKPRLVLSPREEPPFPVDAFVEEEDSYLSLSSEPRLELPGEHPVRVMTRAHAAVEIEPGTIVVRPGKPLLLLAIVHRLHENPTWRETWIAEAVRSLRKEVERRRIRALATPLLGTVHGKMNAQRSFELLSSFLIDEVVLERVWIVRPTVAVLERE